MQKTSPRPSKSFEKPRKIEPGGFPNAPKTLQNRARSGPRRTKIAQRGSKTQQDVQNVIQEQGSEAVPFVPQLEYGEVLTVPFKSTPLHRYRANNITIAKHHDYVC